MKRLIVTVFALAVAGSLAFPAAIIAQSPPVTCQNDVDGANDEPGQKDVTRVCVDTGDGAPYELLVSANWDEIRLKGANTADICTLYDANSNWLADFAICVTLEGSGAAQDNLAVFQQRRFYTCADTRADRCAGAAQLVGSFMTSCEAAQKDTDPFPPSATNGPGDEYPTDTETFCRIDLDDFNLPGGTVKILDACSYPSQQPNSSPSDCMLFTECMVDGDCDDGNSCTTDSCGVGGIVCIHTAVAGTACTDGLFCNGDEICNTLGLCENVGPRDCADGVSCTVDTCDEFTKQCINRPRNSLCADGTFCNGMETCDQVQDCQPGAPPDCDDGVSCTVDSCDEGASTCNNVPNDTTCDDGAYCNGAETCSATNGCEAGVAPSCGDGVGCTTDACDEDTDSCTNTEDDAVCDDGDFCNGFETCDATNDCQGGLAPDCDDSVGCTVDSCNEVTDTCVHTADHSACDDSAYCNGEEICDIANDCQSGLAPDCDDGVSCTGDSCDELNDNCQNLPDDALCNDGLFCTGAETCDAVSDCQDGTPPNCDDGVACTVDDCDEVGNACDHDPNDALCDNSSWCDGTETCHAVSDCQDGTPPDCDDGVACTTDLCNDAADACDNIPDNGSCSDGMFCSGVEVCDPTGDCQTGSDPCPGAFCDEGDDICSGCLLDTDCDNGVFCDGMETCIAGTCTMGTAPNCNDGVGCTDDACDETAEECTHVPQNGLCDNLQFCDGIETCHPVNDCQPGSAPNCNDGVSCTDDACDETADICTFTANHANCDNGQFCDGAETCDPINNCQPGSAPDCNDGVGCTDDSCNEAGDACAHNPVDAYCDNGQFCDGTETCHVVNDCQGGTTPGCNDGINCTDDTCDEAGDSCSYTPVDAICDNGLFCDGAEACNPLTGCETTTTVDCDDGVSCTTDSCSEATGSCAHAANDSLCDDGSLCNGSETCDTLDGCQTGVLIPCSDEFLCSTDSCNPATGICENDFSNCVCGDGEIAGIEECDPPATAGTFEDCNNLIDDDSDGDIDCRDLDCAPGSREPVCDEHCTMDVVCEKFKKDPGLVRYDHPRGHDYFRLHARFPIEVEFNPATQVIEFELANDLGAVYRAIVPPGVLVSNKNGTRYKFKDKTASTLGPESFVDGIAKFSFIKRRYEGVLHATFRIRVFADFLAATKVTMTTQISVGTAAASLTADWTPKRKKWKLASADLPTGSGFGSETPRLSPRPLHR